eukprot:6352547-Amphidinium_carterae.1
MATATRAPMKSDESCSSGRNKDGNRIGPQFLHYFVRAVNSFCSMSLDTLATVDIAACLDKSPTSNSSKASAFDRNWSWSSLRSHSTHKWS